MNPWENLLTLVGWFLVALMIVVMGVIIYAVLLGVYRGIRKWFPATRAQDEAEAKTLDNYLGEATVVGQEMYKNEIIIPEELIKAFKSGARWGWGYHHR